ncbi:hypothetical protein N9M66_06255 [Litoreibacter sp.]|nr:hypothetical protein [Litoreibacter sp.]
MRAQLSAGHVDLSGRMTGVLGIIWPSKKFDGDDAAFPDAVGLGAENDAQTVKDLLDQLRDVLEAEDASPAIDALKTLVPDLEDSVDAQQVFADDLRALLSQDAANDEDASDQFFESSAQELFDRLKKPGMLMTIPAGEGGGAAGGVMSGGDAAGHIGDFRSGATAAARRLLNYTTYYVMKKRAGAVGERGVAGLVQAVCQDIPDLKTHFIGHSFGGRVVTAATRVLGMRQATKPSSVSLLQAAFSHNGFAQSFRDGQDGFFRTVVSKSAVAGPILVTYTKNDKANARAYPIASRIAFDDASFFGGSGDTYGAIGANGAQHTPEAVNADMLSAGSAGYDFSGQHIYNLRSDAHIADHGDVHSEAVAFAILSAITTT